VQKLRASFYDANWQPIAVQTLGIFQNGVTLAPGAESLLSDVYFISLLPVLPDGYKWKVEVTKAHYVDRLLTSKAAAKKMQ